MKLKNLLIFFKQKQTFWKYRKFTAFVVLFLKLRSKVIIFRCLLLNNLMYSRGEGVVVAEITLLFNENQKVVRK